jgi:hypothetical protein
MAASSALYAAHPVDKSRAQIRLIYLEPCPSREDNDRFTSYLERLRPWEPPSLKPSLRLHRISKTSLSMSGFQEAASVEIGIETSKTRLSVGYISRTLKWI